MASLVPWPSNSVPAITDLRKHMYFGDVSPEGYDFDSRLELLGSAAAELVQKFAPSTPQALKDVACVRCVQYLIGRPGDAAANQREALGDASYERSWLPSMTGCLRASGAMAILSAWRKRTIGVVTSETDE